jgi:hypothetical protein
MEWRCSIALRCEERTRQAVYLPFPDLTHPFAFWGMNPDFVTITGLQAGGY